MTKLERTLAVIGSTSVGKSALTIRYINNRFSADYDPTIARTYRHNAKINNTEYDLTVYDTAGLEQQGQIPQHYIKSHGFILVYSIADKQSFEIIKSIYNRLADELDTQNFPLVLIGNKTDLVLDRCISTDEGKRLANEWREGGSKVSFIETSALTGEKVEDVFKLILTTIDPVLNNQHAAHNGNHLSFNQKGAHMQNKNEQPISVGTSNNKKQDKQQCIIS